MRVSLSRSVALGMGSALLGLALIGALAFLSIRKLETGGRWMEHTYRVLQGLQKVQLDLKGAESGAEGYLLTGSEGLRKACWRSLGQTRKDMDFVQEEASRDALPPGSMERLRRLVGRRTGTLQEILDLGQEGRKAAAVRRLRAGDAKETDNGIQSLVVRISRVETWLLRVRQDTQAASTRQNLNAMTAGGLSALLVSLLAGLLVYRQVRRRKTSDLLLKASEEKLRALADAANDAFVTVDGAGNIVNVNPAAEALFGYAFEEVVDRPLASLFPDLGPLEPGKDGPGRDADIRFLESRAIRRDGGELPVDVSVARWEARENRYLTLVVRDASERRFFTRTLLENEHRLFQFLEIVPVGIFVLDGSGRPYYVNPAAREMLGRGADREVPPGRLSRDYGFFSASSGEAYPSDRLPLVKALGGGKSRVEDVEIRAGDRVLPVQMWGAPVLGQNGLVKYAVAAFTDISDQKKVQRVLAEGERRFRAVTDTATDAILLTDGAGRIVYFNRAAEKIFGYRQEEVAGRPFSLLLPDRLQKIYGEGAERVPDSEGTDPLAASEITGRRKDRTEFPMEVSSSLWRSGEGAYRTRILRDVSERKQAERTLQEREEMFRNLFEEGPIGMTLTDRRGRLVNVNQAYCRMLGLRKKELVGRSFLAATPAEDAAVERGLTDKLFSGLIPHFQVEKRYTTAKGGNLWAKLTASVVLDVEGRPEHRLAVVEDVTEVKEIEEMKKDLISVVSHQLKTPVAEINGFIENMLEGLAGPLTPRQEEYLSDMREIGRDNYRLISDLLNASKIERGVLSVDLQDVPAARLVELAVRGYDEAIRRKGLFLNLEGLEKDLEVRADPDKTVETLRNVINNAVKCTDAGGITVSLSEEGGRAVLEVRDTGIGMSEETMGRLFTKSRVLGKEAGRAGAGLGLYIAKNFMQIQGGDISAASRLGEGTRFRLFLPKAGPNAGVEDGHREAFPGQAAESTTTPAFRAGQPKEARR